MIPRHKALELVVISANQLLAIWSEPINLKIWTNQDPKKQSGKEISKHMYAGR